MSVREIQAHLAEIYGAQLSPELISTVTNEVIDEVHAWQERPLGAVYPIVFLGGLRLKIRHKGTVKNKASTWPLAINMEWLKVILGLWIAENEGAQF